MKETRLYEQIKKDMKAAFYAEEFAEEHDINGRVLRCIVHAAGLTLRGVSSLEMAADNADVVVIIEASLIDTPRAGSTLYLDGETMQIQRTTPIAGALIKLSLARVF